MWNETALFFLALLLGGYLLENLALLLDSRAVQSPLPDQLSDWVDAETWQKSQHYTQARHRLALLESTTHLLVLLAFWFSGGFLLLDRLVAGWNLPPIAAGVAYIGLLLAGSYGIGLSFTFYNTFGIEAQFGFNRTSWKIFAIDQLKMMGLATLLGGSILAAILALFYQAGPLAWLYGWLGLTAFSLVMQLVVPRWILPLFNRFTPLADGEPRRAILAYAHAIDFPIAQVFEMDGSRRSSKANAFVTGFGNNRRVALFDTLMQQHTVPELVAILAHEIGHVRKRHLPKLLLLGMLHTGILFLLLSFFLAWPGMYQGFFMEGMPLHAGLLFFGILIGPIDLWVGLLFKGVSRRFEFEADRFALETAPEPTALMTAMKTLARENLTNLLPHPLYVLLHYTHPPVLQRIKAMERHLVPS